MNMLVKNFKLYATLLCIAALSYIFTSIRVSKSISQEDYEVTNLLNIDKECSNISSYDNEITCIKAVQEAQLDLIEGTTCRGKFTNLGSKKVITANTACCTDRARITEQALQIYGFQIRHIHLNRTSKRGYLNLLVQSSGSHATTEVLTSRGWLGIDSTERFVLLDKNNEPNSYPIAIQNGLIKDYSNLPIYKEPITYIIGLYSRNGTYFQPYLPFVPEINFTDFLGNLNNIKIVNPN